MAPTDTTLATALLANVRKILVVGMDDPDWDTVEIRQQLCRMVGRVEQLLQR